MCLTLTDDLVAHIADSDIVAYKVVIETTKIEQISPIKDNDVYKAVIMGITVEGLICIEPGREGKDTIFLCQNDLNGIMASNQKGYKFSWELDNSCKSVIIDDVECMGTIPGFTTFYRNTFVELGETYMSRIVKHKNTIDEALHTFAILEEVNKFFEYEGCSSTQHHIVECIIPTGSTYYIGEFQEGAMYKSYASDTLKYVKLIR